MLKFGWWNFRRMIWATVQVPKHSKHRTLKLSWMLPLRIPHYLQRVLSRYAWKHLNRVNEVALTNGALFMDNVCGHLIVVARTIDNQYLSKSMSLGPRRRRRRWDYTPLGVHCTSFSHLISTTRPYSEEKFEQNQWSFKLISLIVRLNFSAFRAKYA